MITLITLMVNNQVTLITPQRYFAVTLVTLGWVNPITLETLLESK